jgi:hypothetical protein
VRLVAPLAVLALLASAPTVASAQTAPGRSGSSTERVIIGGRDIWDDLNEFGECFAAQQTKDAIRLVTPEAGSVEEARVYKALFSKETACLGDLAGLTVPWQLVRGSVGEGFYKRGLPLPPNLAFSRDLTPDKVKSVMDAATCYAARHPADAQALIERTKPDSKEQAAALDAHWSDFVACLPPNVPAGFKFDTLLLRYRIAESLWRLGYAKGRTQ